MQLCNGRKRVSGDFKQVHIGTARIWQSQSDCSAIIMMLLDMFNRKQSCESQ